MHYTYPALLFVVSLAAAGDIDANDLPTECKAVCAPVVSLTAACDSKTSDDDTAELNCVCKGKNASSILPVCDACITKYSKDGSDNDANDLVRSCSFTTTSFNPSATTATASESSSATILGVSATTTGTMTSSGTSTGSSSTSASSSASATPTDNAAVVGASKSEIGMIGSLVAGFLICLAA